MIQVGLEYFRCERVNMNKYCWASAKPMSIENNYFLHAGRESETLSIESTVTDIVHDVP